MSPLSFAQRTFHCDGGNGFVRRGRCREWDTIALQVSVLKSPDFKTNTGTLYHVGYDPDILSKYFNSLLTPQLHVVYLG